MTQPCSAAVPAAVVVGVSPTKSKAKCRRNAGATLSGLPLIAILGFLLLVPRLPAVAADFQHGTVVRVAQIYLP